MKCLAVAMGVVSLVVHTASCFTLPFMTMPILKQHKASPQKHLFLLVCPENPLVNPCQEAISEVESAVSRLEKAGAEPEEKLHVYLVDGSDGTTSSTWTLLKEDLHLFAHKSPSIYYVDFQGNPTNSYEKGVLALGDKGAEYFLRAYSGIDKVDVNVVYLPDDAEARPKVEWGSHIRVLMTAKAVGGQHPLVGADNSTVDTSIDAKGDWFKGMKDMVLGMAVGEIREGVIPPSLGYGNNDLPNLPKHTSFIVQVELLVIEDEKTFEARKKAEKDAADALSEAERKKNEAYAAARADEERHAAEAADFRKKNALKLTGITPSKVPSGQHFSLTLLGDGIRNDDVISFVRVGAGTCAQNGWENFQFVSVRRASWSTAAPGQYFFCYIHYHPEKDQMQTPWKEHPDIILTVE